LDQRLGVIEAPFLFNNNEASSYATEGILPLYDQILQEKFNAKGLELVSLAASELLTTQPVRKLEDVKGMLIGAVSPVTSALIKDLGGSPVTIMWPDLYESLKKKVVDGTTSNIHAAIVMNFFDVCKYVALAFGPVTFQGLSINLDVWKKMPVHIKKILKEEADVGNAWLSDMFSKLVNDEIKELGQKGISFYFLPSAERERWIKATAAYREKQLTSFGDFGVTIRQIADDANKRYPYREMVQK
jgi:TRAP-type C4-dicarboxylate transport system substrate-binding protein